MEIQIENAFYKGERNMQSNSAEAITCFNDVILQAKQLSPEKSSLWMFKSLTKLVVIELINPESSEEEIFKGISSLMKLISSIASSQVYQSINYILDFAFDKYFALKSNSLLRILDAFVDKSLANNKELYLMIHLKRASTLFDYKKFHEFESCFNSLLLLLRDFSGASSGDTELEVFFLGLKYNEAMENHEKINYYYKKLRDKSLTVGVLDPSIMGQVYETGGKLSMKSSNWEEAYNNFFSSFKNYQEAGEKRAIEILKYVLLINMLTGKEVNPFDSREARAYEDVLELKAFADLRIHYESFNIKKFEETLKIVKLDTFLMKYTTKLVHSIKINMLLRIVKPFSTISIQQLSIELNNTEINEVEQLLTELILLGRLSGKINHQTRAYEQNIMCKELEYKSAKLERDELLLSISKNLCASAKNIIEATKPTTDKQNTMQFLH